MKQYCIKEAYTGNYYVIKCADGKVESYQIIDGYKVQGYIEALESMGYTKGYFVPYFKKVLEEAEESYQIAKESYENAIENPLQISQEEANKHMCFKFD